jgi:predicted GNAT family acetyltransferase
LSDVTKTVEGGHGRYSIPTENGEAVMTFSITSPTLVIVDHTEVPLKDEGKGHAGVLARFLVEDARRDGFKVVPLCPFLNMWRRKHPEAADIFQT